jgi:hypothetical protein
MAVLKSSSSILCNQLVAASQLETSSSQLDGVPPSLEDAIRFHSAHLLQAAGILLRLPQDLIAQAIVLLFRYWTGPDGGSMLDSDAKVRFFSYYVAFGCRHGHAFALILHLRRACYGPPSCHSKR